MNSIGWPYLLQTNFQNYVKAKVALGVFQPRGDRIFDTIHHNINSLTVCSAAACLSALSAGPSSMHGPVTKQSVCGRILLHVQPAGLPQPAGQPTHPHQRAQHCNLELRVSAGTFNANSTADSAWLRECWMGWVYAGVLSLVLRTASLHIGPLQISRKSCGSPSSKQLL